MRAAPIVLAACGMLMAVGGCVSSGSTPTGRASTSWVSPGVVPVPTIMLDAGHGGHDPGAVHYGWREKDLALASTRRVRAALAARGLSVTMTRDRDEFLPLSRRIQIANQANADCFISVHINANPSRAVSGPEVYFPRESVISDHEAWPPGIQPQDVALPTLAIRRILWDLRLMRARWQSARIARSVCRAISQQLGTACTVKPARFVVLREAWVPAVLIELGYLSHEADAVRLATPAYQQQISEAIADGVAAALHHEAPRS